MIQKLSYFLGQDGFLRMNTNLPEFTIFFKKETGFVNEVILLNLEDNIYITKDMVSSVVNKAKWKFIDQGYEDVHSLLLIITNRTEKAMQLGINDTFSWIISDTDNQLTIPDGHVEDFYGLKENIINWLNQEIIIANPEHDTYRANGRVTRRFIDQPLVNHTIFITNMIIFTLCTLTGDLFYNCGRLALGDVLAGDWYRVFTALFLHADVTHIAGNMLMLFLMGNVVEKEMGHIKYFILYFGSGLFGSFASLYLQSIHFMRGENYAGSIGASGAIFGIMGGFLWILLLNHGRASNMSFVRVLFLVCYSLFGGLTETRIDNAAHVGGLFAGILIAILIYRKKTQKETNAGEN